MDQSNLYKIAARIAYRVASGTDDDHLRDELKIFIDGMLDKCDIKPISPPKDSNLDAIIENLQISPTQPHFPERQLKKYLTEYIGEDNLELFHSSKESDWLFKPKKFFESEICKEILKAKLEKRESNRQEYDESQRLLLERKTRETGLSNTLSDAAVKVLSFSRPRDNEDGEPPEVDWEGFETSLHNFAKLNALDPGSNGYIKIFDRIINEMPDKIEKMSHGHSYIYDIKQYLIGLCEAAKKLNETAE